MNPEWGLPILAVVGKAFATGVTTNGISNLDNGENFWANGFSAGMWGAASGLASAGVGGLFGNVTNILGKEFLRAGAHAFSQGTLSHMQGDRSVLMRYESGFECSESTRKGGN